MPLPVIHSFAGYSIYRLAREKDKRDWSLLLLCVLLANLADFDFIPGLFLGKAGHYHRGFSHSFIASIFFGLIVAGTFFALSKFRKSIFDGYQFRRKFTIGFLGYFSHVFLDFFSGPGVPLLWPFTDQAFSHPVEIFRIGREGVSPYSAVGFGEFFKCFLTSPMMKPMFFEAALCCTVLALTSAVKDLRGNVAFRYSSALTHAAQAGIFVIIFMMI